MRVTRLEIFGFKSFVERFQLNFDKNILGVVGPNGCGKSNIVDALRWVLGETHARQLRGSTLEDLIFNGSESRRPLGMAEVSITICPGEGWASSLREKHSEVLEDVESPLAEAEEASEDSAEEETDELVVEGVSPELSVSTEELDAEDPYRVVPTTLMEIPGIFDSAEVQLTRRLYRSGESEYFINRIPCRLRDMTDLYRLIGLGSRGLSIVQQGQIGQLISKKPIERRELLEEAAGISGFRARIETAQRKLERTSDNMARLSDIILEVEKQVRVLKRQANRARARGDLKGKLAETEQELFAAKCSRILLKKDELQADGEELNQQLDLQNTQLAGAEAENEELQAVLHQLDTNLISLRGERDQLYQLLTQQRERVQETKIELTRAESRLGGIDEESERLDRREEKCRDEIQERRVALEQREGGLLDIDKARQSAEDALAAIQEESRQAAESSPEQSEGGELSEERRERVARIAELGGQIERIEEVSEAIRQLEQRKGDKRRELESEKEILQEKRVLLASSESETRSLESQLEELADYVAQSVESRGEDASGQDKRGRAKVLLSGIGVPEDLQRATAAILGDKGGFLVSEQPEELARKYVQSQEADESLEGARFGVIGQNPSEGISDSPLDAEELAVVPSASLLIDSLELEAGYEGALKAILGNVVLVQSLEEALSLNEANRNSERALRLLVTRAGEVVTPWGWYTTEGKGVGVSFKRRIKELREQKEQICSDISSLDQGLEGLSQQFEQIREELSARVLERNNLIGLQKELNRLLQQEKEDERRQQEAVLREERQRREAFLARERAAQSEVRKVETELARARSSIEHETKRIEALTGDIASLNERRESLSTLKEEIERERERLQQELEQPSDPSAKEEAEAAEAGFLRVEGKIKELEKERGDLNLKVAQVAQSISEIRKVLNGLNEQGNSAQLAMEKSQLELSMLKDEISRYYTEGCEIPDQEGVSAVLAKCENELEPYIESLQEDAGKLRKRLEREGEVDPESIALFESEQQRLEEMKTQHADLLAATKTLERTIRQLKEISRLRFLHTFKDVREKFSELVPRLFGGGSGTLELIDPEDPLTSGVEIIVRPPGKRISSMELLSGGEKALVATAVLIAMFLHRPSPICVLDEVDAPLDDVNLERFIGVIQEIASKTQFLIITHNKATMSAVGRLVGITMQESGVSMALTVSLEEAEKEIERWAVNA